MERSKKKILITGAAGFIGRQLSDYYKKKNIPTIDVDDLSVKPILLPQKNLIKKKVQSIDEFFLKKNNIYKIIHLAAKKSVDESFFNLKNSTENYEMYLKLLSAAINSNVKNIYTASTCEIFGFQNSKLSEFSKYKPHSPYAVTKVANEYLSEVFMMWNKSLKITSLIFFNTYGPSENINAVIPKFVNLASKNKTIYIEGDGNQKRNFTYISDCVELIFKIVQSSRYINKINLGSPKESSVMEVLNIIKKYYPSLKIKFRKERINEIKNFKCDNSLAKKYFKFQNKVDLHVGVKKIIDFYN
jgi:dTDP-glucose 4,6-dehydratase/UDP-glucose 4-epimerase